MRRRRLVYVAMLAWLIGRAACPQDFADYYFLPPAVTEGEREGEAGPDDAAHKNALTQDLISEAMRSDHPVYESSDFIAQKDAWTADDDSYPALRVAAECPVLLDSDTLFNEGFEKNGDRYYAAELISTQAYALRLFMDLSAMNPNDQVWVIAPAIPRAFGPYAKKDAAEGSLWAPTIQGDTVMLLVRAEERPALRIPSFAHFYVDLDKAADTCLIHAACQTDPVYQQVATGVARLLIPIRRVGLFLCTGALINAPDTIGHDALMISAHHCFDGDVNVTGIEVFWDYRALDCDGNGVPDLHGDLVPRSYGLELIANDPCLDAELFRLDAVPNGVAGRAWLGWDASPRKPGEAVVGAHHPNGTPLKTCTGTLQATNIAACLNLLCTNLVQHQLRVQWDHGITKQGSSGSPALLPEQGYRIFGMLSNGPVQKCDTPELNIDDFASFQRFFPQIQCYLRPGQGCAGPDVCDRNGCPLKYLFGNASVALDKLRVFRDKVVTPLPGGIALTNWYYRHASVFTQTLRDKPALKNATYAAALPFIIAGAWMD